MLLTVIVCLFGVSGLALQALRWCQNLTMWVFVPLVIMYSVLCLFSMFALGGWLVLLRNLGGERARERYDFDRCVVMDILWIVLLSPYVGLIAAVQWCQKKFCGLSDGEDIEMGTTIPWSRHVPRYERIRSSDTGGSDVSACGAGKSSEQREGTGPEET